MVALSKDEFSLNYWKEHHFLKVPYVYIPQCINGQELEKLQQLKIDLSAKPVPLFAPEVLKKDKKQASPDYGYSKNSVTYYKEELNWLDQHLKPTIQNYNSQMWKFNPLERHDAYEFVCFNEGGFIGEHSDSVISDEEAPALLDQKYHGRLLTQVVHFSEKGKDYEGGILEIKNAFGFWLKVPLKNYGDVVLFPSILPHRVTTISKGRRVTLTTFLSGVYPETVQTYFKNKQASLAV